MRGTRIFIGKQMTNGWREESMISFAKSGAIRLEALGDQSLSNLL